MPDLSHWFGGDLAVGPTGDLATASVPVLTQQRILRRLMTNPGGYIWNPAYGAGIGKMIGRPANPQRIAAVIRAQVLQEAAVAPNPPPTVTVTGTPNGTVTANISYTDAATGAAQTLTLPVS